MIQMLRFTLQTKIYRENASKQRSAAEGALISRQIVFIRVVRYGAGAVGMTKFST